MLKCEYDVARRDITKPAVPIVFVIDGIDVRIANGIADWASLAAACTMQANGVVSVKVPYDRGSLHVTVDGDIVRFEGAPVYCHEAPDHCDKCENCDVCCRILEYSDSNSLYGDDDECHTCPSCGFSKQCAAYKPDLYEGSPVLIAALHKTQCAAAFRDADRLTHPAPPPSNFRQLCAAEVYQYPLAPAEQPKLTVPAATEQAALAGQLDQPGYCAIL